MDHRGGFDTLWSQLIDGSPAKQITDFEDSRIFSLIGRAIHVCWPSRGVQTNDVVRLAKPGDLEHYADYPVIDVVPNGGISDSCVLQRFARLCKNPSKSDTFCLCFLCFTCFSCLSV